MADVITKLRVESAEYDNKIKRATQSLAEMTHAAAQQGNAIDTANKQNIALVKSLGEMKTVATSVRGKMSELTASFEQAAHSYNQLTVAEKNSPFGKALRGSIDQLQGRVKALRAEMNATQASLGSKGGGIGSSLLSGAGGALSSLGPAAIAATGVTATMAGLKKVMGDMVSINMQFEQSSSNLAAVMGVSRDEVKYLTEQAKQLGATTQYTATQILELQANLGRLGFSQEEILNSTKAVQGMATAMGADLGEAANLAGSVLRGFGMDATQMERVASVLSVSTTKSALSFEKLATAMPIVQTAAAKTGFSIEETTAMLGKLTDNGINAASAATQLRKILNDSTTAGTKLANALGGPVRSFDELVAALNKASKAGQTHADSVALVNSKNATALDILRDMSATREVEINGVKTQTSALQELKASLTDCADGMRAMQDEQLNTLQGSITILGSAWEGLMLTFSESNGVIKSVVDSLTSLLTAWTNWRKRNQGGDSAISTYELGADAEAAKAYIDSRRNNNVSDDEIIKQAQEEKNALEEKAIALKKAENAYKAYQTTLKAAADVGASGNGKMIERAVTAVDEAKRNLLDILQEGGYTDGLKGGIQGVFKKIAEYNDQAANLDLVISTLSPKSPKGIDDMNEGGDDSDNSKAYLRKLKAQYEEREKAQIASLNRQAMTEKEYEEQVYAIRHATLEQIAKLYQEDTEERARANAAISNLEIQHQAAMMRFAKQGQKTTAKMRVTMQAGYSQEGITALRKQIQESMKGMQVGSNEYMVQAHNLVDLAAFENLLKTAVKNGIEIDPALLEQKFQAIDDAAFEVKPAVTDEEWTAFVDELNAKLKELDLPPIKLEMQTGNVSQAQDQAKDAAKSISERMKDGVGAVGSFGDSLKSLKSTGESLASAFSGDMDAFDALMTVFDSGVSVMQTVMGVIEAINTLTEISTALKKANGIASATEAAEVVAGKTAETAATAADTAATATNTAALTGEATAGAASSVSGIPIIGPVLAVAAIAAVLGAIIAARSKAKSAGSFATGGIVGGNSLSGDNLIAHVNSGEGILTRQGVSNLGTMLNDRGMDSLHLETSISGENIRVALANSNRRRGGSRGEYAISR